MPSSNLPNPGRTHPHRIALASAFWVTVAAGARSQQPLVEPQATAPSLLGDARKHLEREEFDEALVTLWRADELTAAILGATTRAATRKSIAGILAKIDPLATKRHECQVSVAKALRELAQDYTRKKWYSTALEQLQLAGEFDQDTVRKRLAYVQKRIAATNDSSARPAAEQPAPDDPPSGVTDRIPFFSVRDGGASKWTLTRETIVSPPLGEHTELLIGAIAYANKWIRCDLRMNPDARGWASLIFGAESADDYYIAEYDQYPARDSCQLTIFHWDGANAPIVLGKKSFRYGKAQRATWQTLDLRIRGTEIRLALGDGSVGWIRVQGPRKAHGRFGFFVSGNSPYKQPVPYRRLYVEALPPRVEDPKPAARKAAEPAKPAFHGVFEKLVRAEALLKAGDLEDAAGLLRRVRTETSADHDNEVPSEIRETLATLASRADPLAAECETAFGTVVGHLLALATDYAQAERPQAAAVWIDRAYRLHGAATREQLSAQHEVLTPVVHRVFGLPPESPRNTVDNAALRATFEGGETKRSAEPWLFEPIGLRSPAGDQFGALQLAKENSGGHGKTSIQMRIGKVGHRTLIFGWRSPFDFYLATLRHAESETLTIRRYYGSKMRTLASRAVKFSGAARRGWMTLEVTTDASCLTMRAGTAAPLVAELAKPFRPGKIGLLVHRHSDPVDCRNLVLTLHPPGSDPADRADK